jgi:hypothetical protein
MFVNGIIVQLHDCTCTRIAVAVAIAVGGVALPSITVTLYSDVLYYIYHRASKRR